MSECSYLRWIALALLFFPACSHAAEGPQKDDPQAVAWRSRVPMADKPVPAAQWDRYAREAPEWFQDAKFGIYAHWGPYNLGMETAGFSGMNNSWYPKYLYAKGHPYNRQHEKLFGPLKQKFGYKDYFSRFTVPQFDPVVWADLVAASGAKFAGPVAMHHDGFAMWDSQVVEWNSMNSAAQRDIAGELIAEYRRRGLKIVSSFHHAFNVTGHYYGGRKGRLDDGPIEFDSDLNDPQYAKLYGKFSTQAAAEQYWFDILEEYIVKYEPDQLWFDGGLGRLSDASLYRLTSFYYDFCQSKGIEGVLSQKKDQIPRRASILDYERGGARKIESRTWQTDDSPGPWMFIEGAEFKQAEWVIPLLIDIVSKNGVLLLNIAPLADGSIHPEQQQTLRRLGEWMRVNGEAIYASRPWKVYYQGDEPNFYPADKEVAHSGYANFDADDFRFTQSKEGHTLYVFALGHPEQSVAIKSLSATDLQADARVSLLGREKSVAIETDSSGQALIPVTKLLSPHSQERVGPLVFKISGVKASHQ